MLTALSDKYKAIGSRSIAQSNLYYQLTAPTNQAKQVWKLISNKVMQHSTWSHSVQGGPIPEKTHGLNSEENRQYATNLQHISRELNQTRLDDSEAALEKLRNTSYEQLLGQTHRTPPSISTSGTSMPQYNRIQLLFLIHLDKL